MQCQNCGHITEDRASFCEICGTKLAEPNFCRYCGGAIQKGTPFCPSCGNQLSLSSNSNPPDPSTLTADKKGWRFYVPIIPAIMMVLLCFSDWFSILDSHTYNLFDIISTRKIVEQINSEIATILTIVSVISFIGIFLTALFCILKFMNKPAATPVGVSACVISFLIQLFVFIMTLDINDNLGWDGISATGMFYLSVVFTLLTGGLILACREKPSARSTRKIFKKYFILTGLEAVLLLVYVTANTAHYDAITSIISSVASIYHLVLFHPLIRCKLKQKSIYHIPLYGISILLNLFLILPAFFHIGFYLGRSMLVPISALVYVALSIIRLISCLHEKHRNMSVYTYVVFSLCVLLPIVLAIQIPRIIEFELGTDWFLISLFICGNTPYYAISLWNFLYMTKIIHYKFRHKTMYPIRLSEFMLTLLYNGLSIVSLFRYSPIALGYSLTYHILLQWVFLIFFILYFIVIQVKNRKQK